VIDAQRFSQTPHRGACPALVWAVARGVSGVLLAWGFGIEASAAEVRWASAFPTAMEQARAEQKYVMVDFFTSWCTWCKVLDQKTYRDGRVTALTDRMVSVKVNAEIEKDVASKYSVRGYPTIVFLNPDGSLRQRVTGYQPPEVFSPVLEEVLKSDSELFAVARQVGSTPRNGQLRLDYSRILARTGDFRAVAAQLDTLLSLDGIREDTRAEAELDRWVSLLRGGGDKTAEEVRKGLEKWVKKKGKHHSRRTEGLYFLALAEERDGKAKDARKSYTEIMKSSPGSWFAEEARVRIAAMGT
jgi:thioredoxin-related protein